MAIGAYGTTIPINIANVDIPNLVDISYCYHEKRSYDSLSNANFHRLDSAILTQARREKATGDADEFVEGMYNLQLPLSEFNKKGFYTVYIKPREIEAVIADVSTLTAFSGVTGIVIDTTQIRNSSIRTKAQKNNELVGYRIIYLDDNGARQDYYRIITSNNRCEPVVQSEVFLTIVKNNKGYKEWYGFDGVDVNINSSNVEYSHCFGKITCGFKMSDESIYDQDTKNIKKITNIGCISPGYNIDLINPERNTDNITSEEIVFDRDINYYGDLCYYDNYNAIERVIQPIKHRDLGRWQCHWR